MENIKNLLLEFYNNHGLMNYTFLIFLLGSMYSCIYGLICSLGDLIREYALKMHDKRKELKKNGS